jgi:hypothetical protein
MLYPLSYEGKTTNTQLTRPTDVSSGRGWTRPGLGQTSAGKDAAFSRALMEARFGRAYRVSGDTPRAAAEHARSVAERQLDSRIERLRADLAGAGGFAPLTRLVLDATFARFARDSLGGPPRRTAVTGRPCAAG